MSDALVNAGAKASTQYKYLCQTPVLNTMQEIARAGGNIRFGLNAKPRPFWNLNTNTKQKQF